MKIAIHICCFVLLLFLVGCDASGSKDEFSIEGIYYYEETIYLNPLSSATLDYETNRVRGTYFIEITDHVLVHQYGEESHSYDNLTFIEKDVKEDVDELFSLDLNDLFDSFEKRYDLYDGDTRINLSLYIKDNQYYIAETRYIGSGNVYFTIWAVYKLTDSLEE